MIEALGKQESTGRRVMRLNVSLDLILDLLKIKPEGQVVDREFIECVDDPIPAGAKVVGSAVMAGDMLSLLIEDESFREVDAGSVIAEMNPRYKTSRAEKPGGDLVYDSDAFDDCPRGNAVVFLADAVEAVLGEGTLSQTTRYGMGEAIDALLACLDVIVVTPSQYEALNEFLQNRRLEMLD